MCELTSLWNVRAIDHRNGFVSPFALPSDLRASRRPSFVSTTVRLAAQGASRVPRTL
jgi:hypothetical protein